MAELYIPSYYEAYRQGKQDRRTDRINAMQDEMILQSKKRADDQQRYLTAFGIVDSISRVKPEQRKLIYKQALPRLQQLFPEYPLPTEYTPDLDSQLEAIKTYFGSALPVEYKNAGDTMYRIRGTEIETVGGSQKPDGKIVARGDVVDGQPVDRAFYQFKNDRGDLQEGEYIFNSEYPTGVKADEYYRWVDAGRPRNGSPSAEKTSVQPASPALPTPDSSAGNRAGQTNQGFAIPEEPKLNPVPMQTTLPPMAMGKPQMPSMPSGGMNALMADATMPEGVNRFSTLQPFGSKPMNRLGGSMGIEGFEQAYVGSDGQPAPAQPPVGGVTFRKPSPQTAPRSSFVPATRQQLEQYNIDPMLQSAKVDTTTGELTVIERRTRESQLLQELQVAKEKLALAEAEAGTGKSEAERRKAMADAKKAEDELRKIRTTKAMALQGILKMEDAVLDMTGNQFADTGKLDQALAFTPTPWGRQLRRLSAVTKESADAVKAYIRIAGQGDLNKSEQEWAVGVYPDTSLDLEDNLSRVQSLKQRFMRYNNVDFIVRTPEDFQKVPVGGVYFNAKTGMKMIKVGE